MTTTKPTSLVFPEIAASDLDAVRRFLTAGRDESAATPSSSPSPSPSTLSRPRSNFVRDRKGPTVHNGITRARLRSAAKAG
jgi:hypothetical protein